MLLPQVLLTILKVARLVIECPVSYFSANISSRLPSVLMAIPSSGKAQMEDL